MLAISAKQGAVNVKRSIALIAVIVTQLTLTPILGVAQERTRRPARTPSRLTNASRGEVSPASHVVNSPIEEVVVDGSYSDGEYVVEGHDGGCSCGSCGGGGGGGCSSGACDSYSDCSLGNYGFCNSCSAPRGFCICFPSHGWVHGEYLLWYQKGMYAPPLVTSGPSTNRATAGVLGQTGTTVLYGGNNEILNNERNGGRIRFGWWLSRFPGLGVEGEYLGLASDSETFFRQSTGTPVLARPFFNTLTGREDAELVAFPNVLSGSVGVNSTTEFNGAAFRFRRQLCCSQGCGYSEFCCRSVPVSTRVDGTLGYRFWELSESMNIREQLTSLQANAPGTFDLTDRFATRNLFNGVELGVMWQGRRGLWSLDTLMRVGVGNVHQTVDISGSTIITENGQSTTYNNGLYAQRTNAGNYTRDRFTMIPELGATLGYQFTRRLRLTTGYSLIYWGNVVRPGEQIDPTVNPNLLAPEANPFSGALRPQFQFRETDYWVQGLSFGGEFRW